MPQRLRLRFRGVPRALVQDNAAFVEALQHVRLYVVSTTSVGDTAASQEMAVFPLLPPISQDDGGAAALETGVPPMTKDIRVLCAPALSPTYDELFTASALRVNAGCALHIQRDSVDSAWRVAYTNGDFKFRVLEGDEGLEVACHPGVTPHDLLATARAGYRSWRGQGLALEDNAKTELEGMDDTVARLVPEGAHVVLSLALPRDAADVDDIRSQEALETLSAFRSFFQLWMYDPQLPPQPQDMLEQGTAMLPVSDRDLFPYHWDLRTSMMGVPVLRGADVGAVLDADARLPASLRLDVGVREGFSIADAGYAVWRSSAKWTSPCFRLAPALEDVEVPAAGSTDADISSTKLVPVDVHTTFWDMYYAAEANSVRDSAFRARPASSSVTWNFLARVPGDAAGEKAGQFMVVYRDAAQRLRCSPALSWNAQDALQVKELPVGDTRKTRVSLVWLPSGFQDAVTTLSSAAPLEEGTAQRLMDMVEVAGVHVDGVQWGARWYMNCHGGGLASGRFSVAYGNMASTPTVSITMDPAAACGAGEAVQLERAVTAAVDSVTLPRNAERVAGHRGSATALVLADPQALLVAFKHTAQAFSWVLVHTAAGQEGSSDGDDKPASVVRIADAAQVLRVSPLRPGRLAAYPLLTLPPASTLKDGALASALEAAGIQPAWSAEVTSSGLVNVRGTWSLQSLRVSESTEDAVTIALEDARAALVAAVKASKVLEAAEQALAGEPLDTNTKKPGQPPRLHYDIPPVSSFWGMTAQQRTMRVILIIVTVLLAGFLLLSLGRMLRRKPLAPARVRAPTGLPDKTPIMYAPFEAPRQQAQYVVGQ